MKDSMRKTLLDGAKGLLTLLVIGALLVMVGGGCAALASQHNDSAHKASTFKPARNWEPGKRCRTLGKALTSHVAVLVQKDCWRAGVTSVGIVVLNTERGGAVADQHTKQALIAILGYHPALSILVASKHKHLPFALSLVTGVMPNSPIASKR